MPHESVKEPVLGEESRQQLLAGLAELHDILPDLEREERCGGDCRQFRRLREELLRQLEAYEQEYFPPEQAVVQ